MLLALTRRVPRTKSIFDRTSSRRYSSLDYDTNGYYDHQMEQMIIERDDIHRNHLNFIDSTYRTDDDAVFVSNGHDNGIVPYNDDDNDNDEYAPAFPFLLLVHLLIASLRCFFVY